MALAARRSTGCAAPTRLAEPQGGSLVSLGTDIRGGSILEPPLMSVPAKNADDHSLDADVVLVDVHRRHRLVRRLQANTAIPLAVKFLHRRRIPVQHGDDHLAVVRALALVHDHEIAVADLLVDHRVPANAEYVVIARAADEVIGHRDALV